MESEFHLGEYIAILKRRYIYLILPFLVVLGGSIAVAVLLPPVYQSAGTILIESPQIPVEMIQSTERGHAGERIEIIRQRVMTRSTLYRISEKFDVFKDNRDVDSTTKAVDLMRELMAIEHISSSGGKMRRGSPTIAFRVSFEHRRPEIATRVANELVTLFLEENIKSRSARASETTEQTTSEATYTDYARVSVARSTSGWTVTTADPASCANDAAVTFTVASGGSDTITYFGVGDDASGAGTLRFSGPLDASLAVSTGITPEFAIAALAVTLD